jgi:3-oxoacyl-ACP reductase-like protein
MEALVDCIYTTLGLNLNYATPFSPIPENGHKVDGLDNKSELTHHIMLLNLLGAIKAKKVSCQIVNHPTRAVLPLSPNDGLFGNDGLYSESKISLEMPFNHWSSESWGEYLCLVGTVIG